MLFKFIFNIQAIKATPLGTFLPSIAIPSLGSIITTPTTEGTATPIPESSPASTRIYIETPKGKVSYLAEVARTEESRALGLMYRTSLGQYAGMYFIFDTDVVAGFWMKNCEIPLDMLFIDSQGIIVDVKENIRP